jgi:DNA repair protein RadC
LLGKEFSNDKIMQKILVTMPKKYESKISSLEESKDLTNISLRELVNALQAQEHRRLIRHEESMQGTFQASAQYPRGDKDKRFNKKKKG